VSIGALPFVNWIFWAALASGTLGVVGLTELLGGTTRGYRLFMAWLLAGLAVVLLLSELALSGPNGDLPAAGTAALRRPLVIAFGIGCGAYLIASLLRLPRSGVALATAAIGLAALVVLAAAGGVAMPALFAGQLVLAALALGSVTAAMLLGHWYLVTPRLSPLPLRRMMWLLLGALAVQAAAFAVALAAFSGGGALAGPIAWLTWLRLVVGILLPIGITILALLASRAASLQASTGLLYIGLAFVAAGAIAGSSIAYLTGVPV
jgi:hypothetical protein